MESDVAKMRCLTKFQHFSYLAEAGIRIKVTAQIIYLENLLRQSYICFRNKKLLRKTQNHKSHLQASKDGSSNMANAFWLFIRCE